MNVVLNIHKQEAAAGPSTVCEASEPIVYPIFSFLE